MWSRDWTILLWIKTFANETSPSGDPIKVGPKTTAKLWAAIRFCEECSITFIKWSKSTWVEARDASSKDSLIRNFNSWINASSSLKKEGIWHQRAYCWFVDGVINGRGSSRKNSFQMVKKWIILYNLYTKYFYGGIILQIKFIYERFILY